MRLIDSVTLADGMRATAEGYLEANARTARTGVQVYRGVELGRPDLPTVAVWRDEAEVFAKRSLDTFSRLPVTNDHPAEPVTAETWKDVAVGTTGDDVLRDGEYLRIGLKITDAAAVAAIRAGKRELSVGYDTVLDWTPGTAPDGTPFDARQTAIAANHIAIVHRGRAGNMASIGDGAAWGASPITMSKKEDDMSDALKTVVLGDKAAQVAASDAAIIEAFKADTAKAIADAEAKVTAAKADHDKAIAAKDAEIDSLKAKVLTDAQLDARVQARGDLIAKAKGIAPAVVTDGKTDAEIRRAVFVAKVGDAAIAGKSEDYITARFDIMAEADPIKGTALKAVTSNDKNAIYTARDAALSDAWKGKEA